MANKNAKKALEQFKMQAASEVGVNLNQGYNGDLTSRQAGSIGGQMVNNKLAVSNVFKKFGRDKIVMLYFIYENGYIPCLCNAFSNSFS